MTRNKRHRPTYKELGELIEAYSGRIDRVADHCGYTARSVQCWIADAPEDIKISLLEIQAKSKAVAMQAKLKRPEIPAFIIPSEIKSLVSLYYRLSWAELEQLEIDQVLALASEDPTKPRDLKNKLTWLDVSAILDPLATITESMGGVTLTGWYQHVLYCWVGLSDKSPLWESWDMLPDPTPAQTEETVRAVIKKMSKFL